MTDGYKRKVLEYLVMTHYFGHLVKEPAADPTWFCAECRRVGSGYKQVIYSCSGLAVLKPQTVPIALFGYRHYSCPRCSDRTGTRHSHLADASVQLKSYVTALYYPTEQTPRLIYP